jgi:hypothetical protein
MSLSLAVVAVETITVAVVPVVEVPVVIVRMSPGRAQVVEQAPKPHCF